MPRSHDPTRVELLRQEDRQLNEKRVSISVEDIRGALGIAGTWNGGVGRQTAPPYPIPQFFLQPPSTPTNGGGGGGASQKGGSAGGSMSSLRLPYNTAKKIDDEVDLGYWKCGIENNKNYLSVLKVLDFPCFQTPRRAGHFGKVQLRFKQSAAESEQSDIGPSRRFRDGVSCGVAVRRVDVKTASDCPGRRDESPGFCTSFGTHDVHLHPPVHGSHRLHTRLAASEIEILHRPIVAVLDVHRPSPLPRRNRRHLLREIPGRRLSDRRLHHHRHAHPCRRRVRRVQLSDSQESRLALAGTIQGQGRHNEAVSGRGSESSEEHNGGSVHNSRHLNN